MLTACVSVCCLFAQSYVQRRMLLEVLCHYAKSYTQGKHSRPAVIIFLCSLGLAGPTCPCWASRGPGSSFASLYSSLILTDRRMRALKRDIDNDNEDGRRRTSSRHPLDYRRDMTQRRPMSSCPRLSAEDSMVAM